MNQNESSIQSKGESPKEEEEKKVEETEPVNISPEQVVKVTPKEISESSAKKRVSLVGSASGRKRNTGTKTPAPQLTDNTFNNARKSAAPIIGMRKTSATPSAH